MRTYYEILGVAEHARADEIKRAYRRLARQLHPDLSGAADGASFRQVKQAYETLSNEQRRRTYDEQLVAGRCIRPVAAEEHNWFADEIAIDFPSVSAVMDRIRHAFFGSDELGAPLRAEILLSAHEAFRGVTVPLDVPVRRTCPLCGGRGETWMEPCRACEGTGESLFQHRVRLSVPPRVADGARFRFSVGTQYAPPTRIEVRVSIR